MHNIQRKIFEKLLYVDSCNYAQLRPDGVESNHFAYHLNQLIKDGLVVKRDKAYALSTQGQALVDRLSQQKMVQRVQPHIVTAIDLTNERGQTLVFTRNFQPYFGLSGWPMGKIHLDENIYAAAERELHEKTALSGIALRHRGVVYIDARKDSVRISKVLYHLFSGTVQGNSPIVTPADRGVCAWTDYRQIAPAQCMPGFLRGKALLESCNSLFFEEITETIG